MVFTTLLPDDVSITINGSITTFDITQYNETGGEKTKNYRRTMHRGSKNITSYPTDWTINFTGTIKNGLFGSLLSDESVFDVVVSWSGSYTITYNNTEAVSLNHSLDASDRLVFNAMFMTPYYDSVGSENRVIS